MINEQSRLWNFLSTDQQSLIREGFYLIEDAKTHTPIHEINDYSYLVFPFAKAYEGFLKQLFLDLGTIKKWEYKSNHFRIGKVLSPNLVHLLKQRSVYEQLCRRFGDSSLANELWRVWKRGRNQVFHYFPGNYRAISLDEAEVISNDLVQVMEKAVDKAKVIMRSGENKIAEE